jgi:serine/threonine-protein phosphatase 2A regulatory subunit B
MERRPIIRLPIHNHLRGKLCDLYESDCIFDKFDCSISPDSQYMVRCALLVNMVESCP